MCIRARRTEGRRLCKINTGSHVDDLLAAGTKEGIKHLEATLKKEFEIKVQHNPTMVTGVQIERDRKAKWLKLHQGAYVETILREFGQSECNGADTPLDPGMVRAMMMLPLATADNVNLKVQKSYRKLASGNADMVV